MIYTESKIAYYGEIVEGSSIGIRLAMLFENNIKDFKALKPICWFILSSNTSATPLTLLSIVVRVKSHCRLCLTKFIITIN